MKNNQKKTYLTDKKKSVIVNKMLSKYDNFFPNSNLNVLQKKHLYGGLLITIMKSLN